MLALSVLAEACFVGQRQVGSDGGEWCGLWRTVAIHGIREMRQVSQAAVGCIRAGNTAGWREREGVRERRHAWWEKRQRLRGRAWLQTGASQYKK